MKWHFVVVVAVLAAAVAVAAGHDPAVARAMLGVLADVLRLFAS